ncbi:hypothetical protein CCAX7_004190 [Capsulimonas corticalis]|uniref:Uncharacterized protein n=1 Tax=Capsulimonas corticalis TaxID=2219043 RepID=A0A402D324_9BACT|nr:GGDEF domain-containing protein [Capsulimonas corticalis]BDI28368.1 hypothetical protein CCAX7_004190 [Capsulimonas corticalis]
MKTNVRYYNFFSRFLFPKSYLAKFLLLAVIGMHGPMTIAMTWMHRSNYGAPGIPGGGMPPGPPPPAGVHPGPPPPMGTDFGPLWFIVFGAVFLFFALYALLQPISACSQSLRDYMEHGILPKLPTNGKDEAGLLMSDLQKTIVRLDTLLKEQEHRATRDALTGLANRSWSDARLKDDLPRAQATRVPACLAMIDLDHFKEINDRYGHEAGDQVLQQVGRILNEELRAGDWAARWGGDEFVVMLWNCDSAAAAQVLERIRARVRSAVWAFAAGVRPNLSASIGYCEYNTMDSAEQLFVKSDSALYASKLEGRDCVKAYNPRLQLISEKLRIA